MCKVLPQSFFNRSALIVARRLIGKYIVVRKGGKTIALMVNEIEAYDGFKDRASHAHKGKTMRNKVMFDEAGYIYVYFTYGIHYMLNIVTGKRDYPAAVLIRGAGEINGPGRLTKFLKIDKRFNYKLLSKKNGLWFEDRGVRIANRQIKRTARIGIRYAGEIWSNKKYRFVLNKNKNGGRA